MEGTRSYSSPFSERTIRTKCANGQSPTDLPSSPGLMYRVIPPGRGDDDDDAILLEVKDGPTKEEEDWWVN